MNAQAIQVLKEAQDHVEFVQTLAHELHETNKHVFYALHLIVRTIGRDEATKLLRVVRKVEEMGGLMIKDGSRRRTIGGVFLWCAKQQYGKRLPHSHKKRQPALSVKLSS